MFKACERVDGTLGWENLCGVAAIALAFVLKVTVAAYEVYAGRVVVVLEAELEVISEVGRAFAAEVEVAIFARGPGPSWVAETLVVFTLFGFLFPVA
tara:strand:- start:8 stop:298 length:291 start_codon:yes stop_codon:yes gene_type:complete